MNQNQDQEQLRLLSIFHYVLAGMTALISLFPLVHVAMGAVSVAASRKHPGSGEPPPELIGWVFLAMGAAFIILGMALAVLILVASRSLAQRRRSAWWWPASNASTCRSAPRSASSPSWCCSASR